MNKKEDLAEKIAFGIEKLSIANRVLLWEEAKNENLSPIQIQFLTYIKTHPDELSNIKNLAMEYDLSEATVSDAIKCLEGKGFIKKKRDTSDRRKYILLLTAKGKKTSERVSCWSELLIKNIRRLSDSKKERIMICLMEIIKSLKKTGVINLAKMCLNCRNFIWDYKSDSDEPHYCKAKKLHMDICDLIVDCIDFRYSDID